MNKKAAGPTGILAFAILFIALFTFYVLWVSPSEREALLGGNIGGSKTSDTNQDTNTGSTTTDTNKILMSTTIQAVGIATGANASASTQTFDKSVSYPVSMNSLDTRSSLILSSTVLQSKVYDYILTSVDETADSVEIRFNITSSVDEPVISVKAGGVEILRSEAAEQAYKLNIPVNELKTGDKIEIGCLWTGYKFWQSSTCALRDLSISEVSYTPETPTAFQDFALTNWDGQGGTLKLFFKTNSVQNKGKLKIRLNDILLYEGKPETRDSYYVVETTTNSVGLKQDYNQLKFETEAGGVYELSDVKVAIYGVLTTEINRTVYFTVAQEIYDKAKSFKIKFNVEDIVDPGALEIILPGKVNKYLGPEHIYEGEITLDLSKAYVGLGTNKIVIYSGNGRFNIGYFEVSYE